MREKVLSILQYDNINEQLQLSVWFASTWANLTNI